MAGQPKKQKRTPATNINLPFEEVDNGEIKKAIHCKFTSLGQFCRLTNRDLGELHDNLRYRTERSTLYLRDVWADAKRLANVEVAGYHITDATRKLITGKLMAYSSVLAFCEKHPDFSNVFISRVSNGSTKRITPKVRQLATTLGVSL